MASSALADGPDLREKIESAVSLAENYPERYRTAILSAVLQYRLTERGPGPSRSARAADEAEKVEARRSAPASSGLELVADAADVDPAALRRILEIDDEQEEVQILVPRLGASTNSKRQNWYCAIYSFARENAFGQTKTDIDKLREVCDRHGCYDSSNFTRNFRNRDLLRLPPAANAEDRQYILSNKGVAKAREILQRLCEA